MDRNRVTVRYAKALIELASEQNVLEEIDRDMRILYAAINQYKGFADYIFNPGIGSMEKFAKLNSIFSSQFYALSINFLELIFTKKREEYLKDICRNCIDMARERKHIVIASLKSALPISQEIADLIKDKFELQLEVTLEMTNETDQNLIGGFVFTIDGQQYDASIASKIKGIKQQLQLK